MDVARSYAKAATWPPFRPTSRSVTAEYGVDAVALEYNVASLVAPDSDSCAAVP